jgi:cell filamentation protein
MTDRYRIHNTEGEFEPGSNKQVLRNLVGISSPQDMDELELMLLAQLYEEVLVNFLPTRTLVAEDLGTWHRLWLGNVYEWAGQYRTVNMSKGGFPFAAAAQVPRLMADFEREHLARMTPCQGMSDDVLSHAIAKIHVELIVIHPFREGNGRLSRLLADVMAVQAGREPLDYTSWEAHKQDYIEAIHAGFGGDYLPMQRWVLSAMSPGGADLSEPA